MERMSSVYHNIGDKGDYISECRYIHNIQYVLMSLSGIMGECYYCYTYTCTHVCI